MEREEAKLHEREVERYRGNSEIMGRWRRGEYYLLSKMQNSNLIFIGENNKM